MFHELHIGKFQHEYRFKPGDHLVNRLLADGFRSGNYTSAQLDFFKMTVLEVGLDPTTGFEGYHMVYNSLPKHPEALPGGKVDPWFLKEFVECDFESCGYTAAEGMVKETELL